MDITTAEVLESISVPKVFTEKFVLPEHRQDKTVNVSEKHPKQAAARKYIVNFNRKYIALDAFGCQMREGNSLRLMRLDLNYRGHTNPDGRTIGYRHIHIYTPGYDLKIAYDLDVEEDVATLSAWFDVPEEEFASIRDLASGYEVFIKLCNIDKPAYTQGTLFS